jgi:AcrR family transcriptional regulator
VVGDPQGVTELAPATRGSGAGRTAGPEGAPPAPAAGGGQRALRRAVSDRDKAERRTSILAAAKEVFADKGYHATTIGDIARAAGLSYGSIYWYYDSKETLFHELMTAEAASLQEHIDAAIGGTDRTLGADAPFRAAVRATFEFYEADRALVKLLFRDAYALGERFEQHLFAIQEGFLHEIEAVVASAQSRGVIVAGPPRMIAFCIAALVGQIAHRRLVDDDGLEPALVADFVVSLVLNGLVPRHRAG